MSTVTPGPASPAPAVRVSERRARLRAPLATAATCGAAVLVLAVRDPHVPFSYGVCPLYALTGRYCAGCGVLRATHDLAHLDLASAWATNPLWVLAVPLIVLAWGRWVVRAARGEPTPVPGWVAWTLLAVLVVYSVLRNVPTLAPWLQP